VSTPTDASVLFALSAILGLDQRALFEKAGVEMPREDSHLTIEESLASLAPLPMDDLSFDPDEPAENEKPEPVAHVDSLRPDASLEPGMDALEDDDEPDLDADSELEAEVEEHLERAAPLGPEHQSVDAPAAGDSDRAADREPDPVFEPFSLRPEPVGATAMRSTQEPAFVSPPEPFLITAPTPPVVEPSYMEDTEQRQMYRVRNLATIVLFVGLVIVLLWSLSNTLEALGTWWEEFVGSLRL